ncbi:MAG: chromate transporter [Prevotella sp.]|nr:chromate transporter [Prevotella sp.]
MIYLYLFITFFEIGLFGFGGGYGMLSLIQGEVVSRHHWMTMGEFTDIVAVSQMTPGPIGINSATYCGYTAVANAGYSMPMAVLGSVVATTALVLPSLILMLVISKMFMKYMHTHAAESVFAGLRPAVVGLLAAATLLLCNEENFSTPAENVWQFWISVLLFAVTFVGVKSFKLSPLLMIALSGVAGLLLLSGCSSAKHIPKGDYLLDKNIVRVDTSSVPSELKDMSAYLRQRPNSRWFSAFRLPLGVYAMSGTDTTRRVNRLLQSWGQKPVLYDSVKARQTAADLTSKMHSEGYLDATTDISTATKRHKLRVTYTLHPGKQYKVGDVSYHIADSALADVTELSDSRYRLIHTGQRFSVGLLDEERRRITTLLQNRGYFKFHKEFLSYIADTVGTDHTVNLMLNLQPYQSRRDTFSHHPCYDIGSVVFAWQNSATDTTSHLRRGVLSDCCYIVPGRPFSAAALQQTYNRLGRMGAVRYTNITFSERPDTSVLDCRIQLQTTKPHSISFQPEGTNTAGDLGAAAKLTYQNRNLFRGSELLSIELRGAYEAIRGLEGYSNQDFMEYSAQMKLEFPRFLLPFISSDVRKRIGATTEFAVMYDLQNRPEFHRRIVSGSWRYKWSAQGQQHRYQIDLLDLNYVFMPWISETFRREYLNNETGRNAILRYNYEDLFIMKAGFGYNFSNGTVALRTNVETAGNLLGLMSRLTRATRDDNGHYHFFNIAYAQYVKGDIDFTHYIYADQQNQLVFHIGVGLAWPYGNSTVLPFEKRYFSGGANSVRGWSVRSLGPGTYSEGDGRINFITQTGDMKLDLNLELRTHLFWKLAGAVFLDAGNIWTLRKYEKQPGGQFSLKKLPAQLAASYGMGFRFNFSYFILRFDMGMKAINPAYPTDSDGHFPILHHNFKRDFAFHFAVGMPF